MASECYLNGKSSKQLVKFTTSIHYFRVLLECHTQKTLQDHRRLITDTFQSYGSVSISINSKSGQDKSGLTLNRNINYFNLKRFKYKFDFNLHLQNSCHFVGAQATHDLLRKSKHIQGRRYKA